MTVVFNFLFRNSQNRALFDLSGKHSTNWSSWAKAQLLYLLRFFSFLMVASEASGRQRATPKKSDNGLLAKYQQYKGIPFKDEYSEEILTGFTDNPESWVSVLNDFRPPPKTRLAFDLFYQPLKNFLQNTESEELLQCAAEVFANILQIKRHVTEEDWDLLKKAKILNDATVKLLLDTPTLNMSGETLTGFALKLLRLNETDGYTVMIRFMEISKDPEEFASDFFILLDENYVENLFEKSSETGLFNFLIILAEKAKTAEIHEKLLYLLIALFKYYRRTLEFCIDIDSVSLRHLISVLIDSKLLPPDSIEYGCPQLLCYVAHEAVNSMPYPVNQFQLSLLLWDNYPKYEFERNPRNMQPCHWTFYDAAYWIRLHRKDPEKSHLLSSSFLSTIKRIIANDSIWSSFESPNYSLCMIELIQEFQAEEYFDPIREELLRRVLGLNYGTPVFGPSLVLLEAMKFVEKNEVIPKKIRNYLLNVDRVDQNVADIQHLIWYRREKQRIIEGTSKLFINTGESVDSMVSKFAASLYFLKSNEALTESAAVVVLGQLARLMLTCCVYIRIHKIILLLKRICMSIE
jgi:hypothetical protein